MELLGLESIRLDAIKHLGSKTKVTWILIVLLLVDYTWIATCSEAKAWVSAPGCWNKVWRYLVFCVFRDCRFRVGGLCLFEFRLKVLVV